MAAKTSKKRPGRPADWHRLVAAWLVLAGMGGTSLTYNVWHAAHGHLPVVLAVLYGLAPVGAAMGLSHIVGSRAGGWLMTTVTVLVMLGAMGLSVGATATVVAPVAPGAMRYLFPAVMDAASLVALHVIMSPPSVAPATSGGAGATSGATSPATSGAAGGGATNAPASGGGRPACGQDGDGDGAPDGDGQMQGKRGDIRQVMRGHWDREIAAGRISNGADLNRHAGKDPDYSLGKRYASKWREELPPEMVNEWRGSKVSGAFSAGAGR